MFGVLCCENSAGCEYCLKGSEMSDTAKHRADRCTTHHYACDCREYLTSNRIAELEQELAMNGAQMAGDSALIRGLKQENARLREAAESLLDSVKPRFDLQHNKIVPDLYLDKLREALEAGDE